MTVPAPSAGVDALVAAAGGTATSGWTAPRWATSATAVVADVPEPPTGAAHDVQPATGHASAGVTRRRAATTAATAVSRSARRSVGGTPGGGGASVASRPSTSATAQGVRAGVASSAAVPAGTARSTRPVAARRAAAAAGVASAPGCSHGRDQVGREVCGGVVRAQVRGREKRVGAIGAGPAKDGGQGGGDAGHRVRHREGTVIVVAPTATIAAAAAAAAVVAVSVSSPAATGRPSDGARHALHRPNGRPYYRRHPGVPVEDGDQRRTAGAEGS